MKKALEIVGLTKYYNKNQALKEVSFSVNAGTCFGLLGPNGAGKSTTMKIISCIIDADDGKAEVFGLDVSKNKDKVRQMMGYVPQEITLYEKISAFDNLLFFGELYGVKGKELKVRIGEVLEQVGLLDKAKDPIKSFSGGMKRRINMAAALLHNPKLLILDEPTVGIDPQSRNHIFGMIRQLKEEGMTIIYSTHYMEEVEALCDDIAIIDHGKVLTQGPLEELLEKYGVSSIYMEWDGKGDLTSFKHVKKLYAKNKGWIIETDKPLETMQEIINTALQEGISVKNLGITHSSLETVFLTLTGTSLRD